MPIPKQIPIIVVKDAENPRQATVKEGGLFVEFAGTIIVILPVAKRDSASDYQTSQLRLRSRKFPLLTMQQPIALGMGGEAPGLATKLTPSLASREASRSR